MDGAWRGGRVWRNLKQRLRLKGIGICGTQWSPRASNASFREEEEEEEVLEEEPFSDGVGQTLAVAAAAERARASPAMNLAAALAAERSTRPEGPTTFSSAANETPTFTPLRTLMGLFQEPDGQDRMDGEGGAGGIDGTCCVCMERSKGAAFIPCGHAYCRVCSRELWLDRGSCPLCNHPITEILDIF
ncbi:hypothetical protein NMG60_11035362 [Bertholletia excelsa]